MAPVPLVLEEYRYARDAHQRKQVRLLADLDAGVYQVEWQDSRDPESGWVHVHEGEDPEVALAAVNQMINAFDAEGYRDRWGDPPAPIAMQQVLDAELAAQVQRDRAIDAPAAADGLAL